MNPDERLKIAEEAIKTLAMFVEQVLKHPLNEFVANRTDRKIHEAQQSSGDEQAK